jgi:hypothetical protein
MHKKGYILAALQNPPGIHISITLPFAENVETFIKDLNKSVKEVKNIFI